MTEKYLNECPNLFQPRENLDPPPPYCDDDPCKTDPSLRDPNLFHPDGKLGFHALCDPMQTGQIMQDLHAAPNRNTIYRYSKGIRGADEAMLDMFSNVIVMDDQGVSHRVPITWSSHERAVDFVVQENIRQDPSLVVDRVRLPIMSIYSNSFSMNMNRYTYHGLKNYFRNSQGKPGWTVQEGDSLTVLGVARGIPIDIGYQLTIWTYFIEDMNQILEQIATKFSPIAYIRVQGVNWETIVKLDSIGSNLETEPGNAANRVIKFQINMTVETYIPQPIQRDKAVLKTKVEFVDAVDDREITEVISRLEKAVYSYK